MKLLVLILAVIFVAWYMRPMRIERIRSGSGSGAPWTGCAGGCVDCGRCGQGRLCV